MTTSRCLSPGGTFQAPRPLGEMSHLRLSNAETLFKAYPDIPSLISNDDKETSLPKMAQTVIATQRYGSGADTNDDYKARPATTSPKKSGPIIQSHGNADRPHTSADIRSLEDRNLLFPVVNNTNSNGHGKVRQK